MKSKHLKEIYLYIRGRGYPHSKAIEEMKELKALYETFKN